MWLMVIYSPWMKPYNLESFLFIKNVSIMKNLTDFRKTVKTGVDPRLTKIKFNASRGEEYFARGTEVALTLKASLFQAFR